MICFIVIVGQPCWVSYLSPGLKFTGTCQKILVLKNFYMRPKKINMFLRHFFQKKMREGDFLFFTFCEKNDVLTMFRENFWL